MPLLVYVTVDGSAAFTVQPGLLVGQAVKLYEFAEAIGTNTVPASKPNSNRVFMSPPLLQAKFSSSIFGDRPKKVLETALIVRRGPLRFKPVFRILQYWKFDPDSDVTEEMRDARV